LISFDNEEFLKINKVHLIATYWFVDFKIVTFSDLDI